MQDLFKIYQVDEVEALRIQSNKNEIHQHDFEELIIGVKGKIEHYIDFKTQIYEAPFVSYVSRGKMHKVIPLLQDGSCLYWVLRFKSEFIPETTFNLYSYYHEHANLAFQEGRCFDRLLTVCSLIYAEMQQDKPELAIVRPLLSSLLIMVESERNQQDAQSLPVFKNHDITFKNFLQILEENYRRPEGVHFYAEKLFMSTRQLNSITQHILQQSVSELIETRKLIEAKNLLLNSLKTVAEIGFELGYSDKAYFSQVFKKKSGQTPTEFRSEAQKINA